MIEEKFVDLYVRNSGLRDKLVAERDVVLTYALRALSENGVMEQLAFKGGTCLRKIVFGTTGRFSEDLDFTLDTSEPEDSVLVRLIDVFNMEHHGIAFELDACYKTDDNTSFGGEVLYRHAWNSAGRFGLQVSLRERPTLPVKRGPMKPQSYFAHLEFDPFDVRSMATDEMIAEKVRAAFQRTKVRDLYDLFRFSAMPFDGELLRRLCVLKLWQVRDVFDPEAFFTRLRSAHYDWADLGRLIRSAQRIEADEILSAIEKRFAVLNDLSDIEQEVINDARSGWNEPLADRLRAEIRAMFGAMV